MSYFNPDGKLFKREIKHLFYSTTIVISIIIIYMSIWLTFFYNPNEWKENIIAALVIALWLSTLIIFHFRLPHFNIPETYSESKKRFYYLIDIGFSTFLLILYFYKYDEINQTLLELIAKLFV